MHYVRVVEESKGALLKTWYHIQRKRWWGWETVRSYLWECDAVADAKKLSALLNTPSPARTKVIYTNAGSWQPKLWF